MLGWGKQKQMKKKLAVFLSGMLFLACSKSEDEVPNVPAKVSLLTKAYGKNLTTGNLGTPVTYSYDDQKRLSTIKSPTETETFTYETGKITHTTTYTNTATPTQKSIFFYNEKGMIKEEIYKNNILEEIATWKYRTDGGKEIAHTKPNGNLIHTKYIRFSDTGNIERVAVDVTDVTGFDYEYVFEDFDTNKLHYTSIYFPLVYPKIIIETNIAGLKPPNNPRQLKISKTGTNTTYAYRRHEYLYNSNGQVIERKTFDLLDNNKHLSTEVYEYQEF